MSYKEDFCGIYKIENLINGKVYIGQSKNIKQRWLQHKNELNRNCHHNDYLQKSWNKYGENNFSFEIIVECSKDKLNELEKYYISKYNSFNDAYGYNLTSGGDASDMKISNYSLQKKIEKLSGNNSHQAKKVICLETMEIFDTIVSAANKYGVTYSNITRVCIGENDGCQGLHWMFLEDYMNSSEEEIKKRISKETLLNHQKPVICLNTLEKFDSIKLAGEYFHVACQSIGQCCKGKRKSAGKDKNGNKLVFMFYKDYLKQQKLQASA